MKEKKSVSNFGFGLWTIAIFIILLGSWTALAEEILPGDISESIPDRSVNHEEMSEPFNGTVLDMINAGRVLYIQIDNGKDIVWAAVPSFEGKKGDKVMVPPGVPVANFHSRRLDRKFEMVYFVGSIKRLDADETKMK